MVETRAAQKSAQSHLSGVGEYWDDRLNAEAMLDLKGKAGRKYHKADLANATRHLKMFQTQHDLRVLEVGGGIGRSSKMLAQFYPHIDMID